MNQTKRTRTYQITILVQVPILFNDKDEMNEIMLKAGLSQEIEHNIWSDGFQVTDFHMTKFQLHDKASKHGK